MKISLFCNAGMSTSLVAAKLKESFEKNGKDYSVEAYDFSSLANEIEDTDIVILGPQIAWALEDVQKDYPNKKTIVLSMQEFGSMNGDIVRERIEKEINL